MFIDVDVIIIVSLVSVVSLMVSFTVVPIAIIIVGMMTIIKRLLRLPVVYTFVLFQINMTLISISISMTMTMTMTMTVMMVMIRQVYPPEKG